ncbi:MAG: thioredoxin fold domain-containing protein, partial [Chlorobi bacterium]|nr:thioredoxin fold domain-containing protein [Chlorobiota bacterium]
MNFKLLIISIIFVAFNLNTAKAQDRPQEADGKGIIFFDGSWQEALIKSKEENKPIFLDVWAVWCAPCKMLKKNTFPDEEVGKFFNDNFINLSLDGEKGDGAELVKKFGIQAYPSLIILNTEGKPIAYYPGYLKPADFLEFGKTGI